MTERVREQRTGGREEKRNIWVRIHLFGHLCLSSSTAMLPPRVSCRSRRRYRHLRHRFFSACQKSPFHSGFASRDEKEAKQLSRLSLHTDTNISPSELRNPIGKAWGVVILLPLYHTTWKQLSLHAAAATAAAKQHAHYSLSMFPIYVPCNNAYSCIRVKLHWEILVQSDLDARASRIHVELQPVRYTRNPYSYSSSSIVNNKN